MKKIGLIILDGFGLNENIENNAIKKAITPTFDKLFNNKYSELEASEEHVGLPKGQMGNSEVGHLTIGAGRKLEQSLMKIDNMLFSGEFEKLPEFLNGINHCKINKSKLHLFGLFSNGGVHSSIKQLCSVIEIIPKEIKVCLHLFSDGRDTAKDSILNKMEKFLSFLTRHNNIEITTISGRFYAMDRDNNWERTKHAYDTMMNSDKSEKLCPLKHIKKNYANKIFDEMFEGKNFTGNIIENGDSIFHLNFRSDRGSQLIKIFQENEVGFKRKKIENLYICTMTKFYKEYTGNVFIKPVNINNTLGEVLQNNNLTQLHLAETEKYAHVTKFFNGGKQIVYKGEKDILVPSPKVINYVKTPEMSAYKILEIYIKECNNFDFTVINFSNGDMLGHTGDMNSTIKTVEILDDIVLQLLELSEKNNIDLYITADHGNCEVMFNSKGDIVKSHTTNRVPLWYIKKGKVVELYFKYGTLAHIAPIILNNFEIEIPEEMS